MWPKCVHGGPERTCVRLRKRLYQRSSSKQRGAAGQVDHVLDACVHALAARGTVHVCGVAAEEHAAVAQRGHVAAVDPEARTPVQVVELGRQVHGAVVSRWMSSSVGSSASPVIPSGSVAMNRNRPSPIGKTARKPLRPKRSTADPRVRPSHVEVTEDVIVCQRLAGEGRPSALRIALSSRRRRSDTRRHAFPRRRTAAENGIDAVVVLGNSGHSTPRSILTPCRFSCSVSSRSVSDCASSST